MVVQRSVDQFKDLVRKIVDNARDREETAGSMPLLDTTPTEHEAIPGLTPNENRELDGVLNPSDTVVLESRVGDNGALQIQADHFQEAIDKTFKRIAELDRGDSLADAEREEFIDLYDRVAGLKKAQDRTLGQRQVEEVREQQEIDIDRLQKLKKWAKENMVGLGAVAISVAGIITTIIIAGRSAVLKGAMVTKSFAQAVKNAIAKMGPWAVGLANLVYQVLTLGAKGLAWLAQNLWVLVVVFAWFAYDYYKLKR